MFPLHVRLRVTHALSKGHLYDCACVRR